MTGMPVADYYEVLQVSSHADSETIEGVYRHLARRYHPDNRESGNSDHFTQVVEAYQILSNPERRAEYDVGYERVRLWAVDHKVSSLVSA